VNSRRMAKEFRIMATTETLLTRANVE